MNYYYGWYTQDGRLRPNEGRIVIYQDAILVGNSPSMDHNDLLRALASRYRLNKNDVIDKAIRLYYAIERSDIIISPVRQIDDDMIQQNRAYYARLIKKHLK